MSSNRKNPFKNNTSNNRHKNNDKFKKYIEKHDENTNKKRETFKINNSYSLTNSFKQKGVSAFSKSKYKDKNSVEKVVYKNEERKYNIFKSSNRSFEKKKNEIKTFVEKEDDFPLFSTTTPCSNDVEKNPTSKTKNIWHLFNKIEESPTNEQPHTINIEIETKDISESIQPGWVLFDKKTHKIIRNKDDQAYLDYVERMENREVDEEEEPEEPFILNDHQIEQNEFTKFIEDFKYKQLCGKLNKIYDLHYQEDETRGYSRDVDSVQSWELDDYLEKLEWEKRWAQMEENELYGISDDEEETEASDLEYW